jgi:hypothetical protein
MVKSYIDSQCMVDATRFTMENTSIIQIYFFTFEICMLVELKTPKPGLGDVLYKR